MEWESTDGYVPEGSAVLVTDATVYYALGFTDDGVQRVVLLEISGFRDGRPVAATMVLSDEQAVAIGQAMMEAPEQTL